MKFKIHKILISLLANIFLLFFIAIFSITLFAQDWTEPVNISPNMPGLDNQPDLCIDNNGTLHCVFTHKLDNNWRKIYYSKSTDDGLTWTTPEDISLNEDTSLMNPHIVSGTNNQLYVAYDYNTGNPSQTMIYLKTFNGIQWSNPFIITEGLYSSDHNQLIIDNNDRLYCFWYYNGESYYRYYENEIWSEAIIPYPDEYYWIIGPITIDNENNLNCIGAYLEEGQTITEIKVISFKYLESEDIWTDKTIISNETYIGSNNWDIDIDNSLLPHVVYRQKTSNTGQYSDSSMYTFDNGIYWTEPELVVNDPYEQRIAVDHFNRVHIIDREKMETGYKLVHYQDYGGFWQGYIIDTSQFLFGTPKIYKTYCCLNYLYTYSEALNDGDIVFTKYDITTGTNHHKNPGIVDKLNIYPNPFKTETTIHFKIDKARQIIISIYDLNGNHIKTLKNEFMKATMHRITWTGKDKYGKDVDNGTYIVLLQSGRKVVSKPIVHIK